MNQFVMNPIPPQARAASAGWVWALPAAAVAVVLFLIGLEAVPALAIVLMDAAPALVVLAAAGLAGGWIVTLLGLQREPLAVQWILGGGVGIGLLSLAVLGLGQAGWLNRPAAFILVGVTAFAGLLRLAIDLACIGVFRIAGPGPGPTDTPADSRRAGSSRVLGSAGTEPSRRPASRWLWLLVCPFVAVMLLGACLPPGILWAEEAGGYDVLEYHLAVPKAWAEQGRISFLPGNVYSNFPFNSEMLSLLMMLLRGDAIEASFMAVAVNAGLAGLLMAGAWLLGRQFSPSAGLFAGILAGTTPWVAYLAGIAYVEVGMLAMGVCALAAALRAARPGGEEPPGPGGVEKPRSSPPSAAMALLAGLLAGLACGYKYTAGPMIAAPAALVLMAARRKTAAIAAGLLAYGCGAALTFSPWMIRNTLNTGNPFFPLAYSVFGDRSGTWDEELNARWREVHGSALAERTDEPLHRRVWSRTLGDERFNWALLALGGVGALRRRDRWTAVLLLMLAVQVGVWLVATHLFARFAVVMLLPLLGLSARAAGCEPGAHTDDVGIRNGGPRSGPPRDVRKPEAVLNHAVTLVLIVGTGWNLYVTGRLYYHHTRAGSERLEAYGRVDWFEQGHWPGTRHFGAINELPGDARVMLVGEARTFYLRRACDYAVVFNRQPLAEAFQRVADPQALIGWLRERGVTHLLVHWAEIDRLARTYKLDPSLGQAGRYHALAAAGLRVVPVKDQPDYFTLFEVPRP
ncbi:MAG: hypothetical protein HRF43_01990 [Phycisphaerae bacterium]